MRPTARAAAAAALAAVTLAGCGLQSGSAYVPSAGPAKGQSATLLKGATISVGSKQFTEQRILGKMTVILLRAYGANVTDSTGIPGSVAARQAELKGDVNLQWEYTGTAWVSYLGHATGIPDQTQQYEAVRAADAKNGLAWLHPAKENNSYEIAVRKSALPQLKNITKLSQLAQLPVRARTFCVESEFASRNDGFEPLLKKYGIPLGAPNGVPRGNVRTLDTGVVYTATASGTCNFGEVFNTDGRIFSLNLQVLKDDRHFFPAYNPAPVVTASIVRKYPQLADLLRPMADDLTDSEITELNRKVDVEGAEPAQVAHDWLVSKGLVS